MRSITQAILVQAGEPAQREVLRDLVETYPGFLLSAGSGDRPGFNPIRAQIDQIFSRPQSRPAAQAYLDRLLELAARFDRQFPRAYGPAKKTLRDDIAYARKQLGQRHP